MGWASVKAEGIWGCKGCNQGCHLGDGTMINSVGQAKRLVLLNSFFLLSKVQSIHKFLSIKPKSQHFFISLSLPLLLRAPAVRATLLLEPINFFSCLKPSKCFNINTTQTLYHSQQGLGQSTSAHNTKILTT